MPRVLIWDLPTRIFHWLLTFGFLVSAALSVTVDEDSPLFTTHMIVGIVLAVMVLLTIRLFQNYDRITGTTSFPGLGSRFLWENLKSPKAIVMTEL